MSRSPVLALQAEVTTLERFLEDLPEARFLERMGLESRLERARQELAALEAQPHEGRRVRLETNADVAKVMDTLKDEDISERPETFPGQILGILPESRAFECRLDDGRLLRGKVDRSIEDILAFKRQWELIEASLRFRVIAVRKKERYVLMDASR